MFNYFVIDEVLFFVHYIDVVSNCLYFHFFPREVVIYVLVYMFFLHCLLIEASEGYCFY